MNTTWTRDSENNVWVNEEWTITKEFYADGPSLFTWVVRRNGEHIARDGSLYVDNGPLSRQTPAEFDRLKDAKAWVYYVKVTS